MLTLLSPLYVPVPHIVISVCRKGKDMEWMCVWQKNHTIYIKNSSVSRTGLLFLSSSWCRMRVFNKWWKTITPSSEIKKAPSVHMSGILDNKIFIKVAPLLPTRHGVPTCVMLRVIQLKAPGIQEENKNLEHHRSQLNVSLKQHSRERSMKKI